jgi:O-antigen/teichoic acid export membrane protein
MAKNWLTAQQLPISEVHIAIQLMAVSVSLRWMSGLYRGQISGAERLVLLSGYNAAIATIRFVGVLAVLMLVSITPAAFFSYQLGAAIIELAGLMVIAYRLLPLVPQGERLSWSWTPVKPVLKFSLTIALTSSAWVLVTQTDKLVLSKILPLAEYGYFTLAVLVASGVMIISGPVSGAIMPRMAKLNAEGNETELIRLYRNASQLVGVIAIPAALVLAFFSEQLLWAWTGNAEIVRKAAPVLTLYALGNAILALGAFPFYLQYAKGDLKIHLIGTAVFIAMLLPGLFWAASHYGINGPGYAWFGTNIVFFLLWPPIVHRRFGKVLHTQWLRDLGGIVSLTVVGAISLLAVVSWPEGRASVAMKLAMISLLLLVLAASGSSLVRETINLRWCALFPRGIGRQ